MASGAVLSVSVIADAARAQAELDKVGGALDGVQADAARAGRSLEGIADASDSTASAASQAAGGLGDLGGALSGLPGPLGAVGRGMEAAAPAIMGVTGAADLLNLVTARFPSLARSQATATNASTVATVASTGATRAATIATRLLSGAMRTIPLLLIIAGLALLVAHWDKVKRAIQFVWDKIREFAPGAVALLRGFADLAIKALRGLGDFITTVLVGAIRGIRSAFVWVKDKLGPIVAGVLAILRPILNMVNTIIEGLNRIDGDTTGNLGAGGQAAIQNGLSRVVAPAPVQITVEGALDPLAVGRQIQKLLRGAQLRTTGAIA